MKTLGKKEDFGWAVLTAAATTLVVELSKWAIEAAKKAVADKSKPLVCDGKREKDVRRDTVPVRAQMPYGPGAKAAEEYRRNHPGESAPENVEALKRSASELQIAVRKGEAVPPTAPKRTHDSPEKEKKQ